jgi:hypothetical protein
MNKNRRKRIDTRDFIVAGSTRRRRARPVARGIEQGQRAHDARPPRDGSRLAWAVVSPVLFTLAQRESACLITSWHSAMSVCPRLSLHRYQNGYRESPLRYNPSPWPISQCATPQRSSRSLIPAGMRVQNAGVAAATVRISGWHGRCVPPGQAVNESRNIRRVRTGGPP